MAENIDGRTLSLSDRDPNPGPLLPKLMAGRNVSIKNFGQTVKIDVDVPLTEGTRQAIENMGKVCVQQEDTPEYLRSKILQGDRITITDNDHTLTINADVQNGDHKVLASSADTTPDYLDQKLSGSGVVAVTDNTTSLSVGITPSVTDGQVLTTDNGAVAWKTPATQTGDHKVAVNSSDSSPDYLFDKIEAGTNISTSVSSGKVKIDAATQTGDHKVLVDSSDTNPQYLGVKLKSGAGVNISYYNHDKMEIASLGQAKVALLGSMGYLGDKILQGSGITLTKTDNDITIAANTQTGDHKVLASSGDSTADYLGNKLVQGAGITLTKGTNDVTIAADTQTGDHKVLATSDDTTSAGALADKLYVFSPLVQSTATAGGVKRVTFKINAGADGKVLTSNSGNVSWETPAVQTGDHKVVVDGNDTTPGYLASKLTAGSNVTITNNGTDLEISATDTGFANPMTAKGDLIAGGVSGAPYALSMGTAGQVLTSIGSDIAWSDLPGYVKVGSSDTSPDYLGNKLVQGSGISFTTTNNQITIAADTQTGDHKVLSDSGDGLADYLGNKITVSGGLSKELLTVGTNTRVGLSIDTTGSTSGQVLTSTGSGVSWSSLPLKIDWVVNPGLGNGSFNQSVDRTFYVRIYPTFEFKKISDVGIIITGPSASDEWRVAVFDSARNMVAYGTKTGGTVNFQRVSLTMLSDFAPTTTNYYYLAVSQHVAGTSNSKILTTSVTSPSFCWYEDVALTSGRAMPATSNLTASSSKVPIIGLRGR